MTFAIKTKKQIAIDSPDHLCPVGCVSDNFSSPGLIDEVLQYFGDKKITALDLGCAGGQFVVDFINRGHNAIGMDGSSHVFLGSGKENWGNYFNTNLFLCDLTEEYQLYENDVPLEVDYIHSEEVFEHIHPDKLDVFLQQIRKHLKDDGICSFGISMGEDVRVVGDITYVLHQSVFPSDWWKNKLIETGFEILEGGLNDSNHFGYIFNHKVRMEAGESSCYFVVKKKNNVKKLPLSVGILAWNSGETLKNTLLSYQKNGLFDIANDITLFFQEPSEEDIQIANQYDIPYIGVNENIGIGRAFIELSKLSKCDNILLLEHDWELVEDKETTFGRLNSGIELLNSGFNHIRYRHRRNPGYPVYAVDAYRGKELNNYQGIIELESPHLLECVQWMEHPELEFPDKISKKGEYFITTSRWSCFTNNPGMYKKDFYINTVSPFMDKSLHLENDISYWWARQNFKVSWGEGLFKHNDIKKHGYTCLEQLIPEFPKKDANSIAFIFAHRETDVWSTGLSIVNEFKRLGWKTEIYSLFDNNDNYVDDNIHKLLETNPNIIIHMDFGQHTSPILSELKKTSAFCIMESGDDPQRFQSNCVKAPWFDLILSPDIRCVDEYKRMGYNAEWYTHFSDTKCYFPLDEEPTKLAVCSRGTGNDAYIIDSLSQKYSDKIVNQNGFWGSEHNKFLNSGFIVLQQSRYGEITRRIFEGMSCKKLVLADRLDPSTKIQDLFVDGNDIVFYDSEEDCLNKIIYYSEHPEEAKQIAENGYNKVLKNHTEKQRVQFIIDNWKMSKNYEFHNEENTHDKKTFSMKRTEIINLLIQNIGAKKYLEIGVSDGKNFSNIKCDYKIGVDPSTETSTNFHLTSDEFFNQNEEKFDVIFVDGLHHADQVYRDVMNSLQVLNGGGYIVCHDLNPVEEQHQTIPYRGGAWNGDCWKAFVTLRMERDDLEMYTVDSDCGCGIITRGSQKLLNFNYPMSYQYLDQHRKELLNLISPEEFLSKFVDNSQHDLSELLYNYINDPENPENNFLLGFYYDQIGQTASALSYYLRSAERSEDDLHKYECLIRGAICFDRQGTRNFTVKSLLLHSLALCPHRPEGYYFMSLFHEKENKDGSWNESYTIASIGLKVSDLNPSPLRTSVDYPGEYALHFRKALTSWNCGLCEESRDLFLELLDKYEMIPSFKQIAIDNLNNMNVSINPFAVYTKDKFDKLKVKFDGAENIQENYSEAYQDMFVLKMLNGKRKGTYLEVGAGNAFYGNNTALLEREFDWKGVALDIDEGFVAAHTNERSNPCLLKDATKINYVPFLNGLDFPNEIDYLQLDCDPPEVTYKILLSMPFDTHKFAVITYEHDYYCDETKSFQEKSRKYLESYGYIRVVNNISPDDNRPYEDWWVHPDLVEHKIISEMMNISDETKKAETMFLL